METRARIRLLLVTWTRIVCEERGINPPADTINELAAFLDRHTTWLAEQPYAGDPATQFAKQRSRARRIAYPDGTRTIEVGHCQRETDGIRCDGVIKAILRRVDSLLPSAIVCDTDPDHTWDPTQWLRLGRQLKAAA
jgi:hypothetical protein